MPVIGVTQLCPRAGVVALVGRAALVGKPFAELRLADGIALIRPTGEGSPAGSGMDARVVGRTEQRAGIDVELHHRVVVTPRP